MKRLFVSLIALVAIGFSLQTRAALTHEYQLNENPISNGTTAVDSADSVNGTYGSGVTSTTGYTGAPNSAAHFDGSTGNVFLTSGGLVGGLPNFTITAFFKPDVNFAAADRFIYDESAAGDASKRPDLLLRITSGQLQFGVHNGGTFNFATTSSVTLDINTWYLAAGVLNSSGGETVYLFDALTRQLIASGTNGNTSPSDPTANATIGAWTGAGGFAGPQNPFLGSLQDVRLYDSALTQAQIAAVPEPSTEAILSFGAVTLATLIRCRRRPSRPR
jgi:hypothetical protein